MAAADPRARRAAGIRTPKQGAGEAAEDAAAQHLAAHGCAVLDQNARCPQGELDLVAGERNAIVFVEVRMRRSGAFGEAAASVGRYKQKRLMRTSSAGCSLTMANAGSRAASTWSVLPAMAQSNGSATHSRHEARSSDEANDRTHFRRYSRGLAHVDGVRAAGGGGGRRGNRNGRH